LIWSFNSKPAWSAPRAIFMRDILLSQSLLSHSFT
jgi:hypothetical protein